MSELFTQPNNTWLRWIWQHKHILACKAVKWNEWIIYTTQQYMNKMNLTTQTYIGMWSSQLPNKEWAKYTLACKAVNSQTQNECGKMEISNKLRPNKLRVECVRKHFINVFFMVSSEASSYLEDVSYVLCA